MKLHEIKDVDAEDEFPTAKLKVLSGHVYNGRAFVSERDADKAYEAAEAAKDGEGDVSIWYYWESETVYEISVASTNKAGMKRVMDAVKKAVPRANMSMAHKSGMINHEDWREYV